MRIDGVGFGVRASRGMATQGLRRIEVYLCVGGCRAPEISALWVALTTWFRQVFVFFVLRRSACVLVCVPLADAGRVYLLILLRAVLSCVPLFGQGGRGSRVSTAISSSR